MPIVVTSNFTGEYDKIKNTCYDKASRCKINTTNCFRPGTVFHHWEENSLCQTSSIGQRLYRFLSYEARVRIEKFYYVTPRWTPK